MSLAFPFFGLITAMLKYNSHTIQYTYLKGTIQYFLIYSESCVSIISQINLVPLTFPITLLPNLSSPHSATTDLFSVSIDLPNLELYLHLLFLGGSLLLPVLVEPFPVFPLALHSQCPSSVCNGFPTSSIIRSYKEKIL